MEKICLTNSYGYFKNLKSLKKNPIFSCFIQSWISVITLFYSRSANSKILLFLILRQFKSIIIIINYISAPNPKIF